jgi:hypothetical protein
MADSHGGDTQDFADRINSMIEARTAPLTMQLGALQKDLQALRSQVQDLTRIVDPSTPSSAASHHTSETSPSAAVLVV